MDVTGLFHGDVSVRIAARRELVAVGAPAVAPVLRARCASTERPGAAARVHDHRDRSGRPHAEEAFEDGAPPAAHATTVAARASIDPSALGPHSTVDGRALLAPTACGVELPSAPGAPGPT